MRFQREEREVAGRESNGANNEISEFFLPMDSLTPNV